ncbi:hypothetical protein KBI23_12300 [bacterium]|nr:hypothetical protein [bacterium]MBP9810694.1 hypothetical protein [bacterium]
MLHNLEEEERVKGILLVLDHCLTLTIKINEIISRMTEKRVTLEEKMIRTYFHQFAANLVSCAASIHQSLANAYGDGTTRHEQKTQAIVTLAGELLARSNALEELLGASEVIVDDLLKILRYDLNFLEQYYEYGLYTKLTNECDFVVKSKELLQSINNIKPT